jgi:hypothetical protein
VTFFGLPWGTGVALAVMAGLPALSYVLYRIDAARGDGRVTGVGVRAPSDT